MSDEFACCFCGLSFDAGETRYGAGDGSGQRFAHSECWWRRRAEDLEAVVRDLLLYDDPRSLTAMRKLTDARKRADELLQAGDVVKRETLP